MPLADLIEATVTSIIESKNDADLDAAFDRHVHREFKFDGNGRKTNFDGWKNRWQIFNSTTKDRKLDVKIKMGSDEGPMDAFANTPLETKDTVGFMYVLSYYRKVEGEEDKWVYAEFHRIGVSTFEDGKIIDLKLAIVHKTGDLL